MSRRLKIKVQELVCNAGIIQLLCILNNLSGQNVDKGGVIDLTEEVSPAKISSLGINVINYIAIFIIVLLLCGIYVLFKMLNNKKSGNNIAIQILDKFYLDNKNIIYVIKIYDEIIKIAVNRNGVTYLGSTTKYTGENGNFYQLVKGENVNQEGKLNVSTTYMKIIDSIEEIDNKIKKWQGKTKTGDT